MKILVIGSGSIGKRHMDNIISLGYTDVHVVTRSGSIQGSSKNIAVYHSLEYALTKHVFQVAVVCTPTTQHVTDIKQLAEAGVCKMYVEKPVSHNYNSIEILSSIPQHQLDNIKVGYDLHFDPGLQKVKQLLTENIIGSPLSINAVVGQYLPDWRPAGDYTKGVSANIKTGGGVLLDLVHEFDYVYWLMGPVDTIAAQYIHSGALNIETEDVADILLKFETGATGSIHFDYLQPHLVRNCIITGSKGTIRWDLTLSEVTWTDHQKNTSHFSYKGFERNDRFKLAIKTFLEDAADSRLTNFQQGLVSLKMVLAAKHSSQQQVFVKMKDF